MIQTALKRAIKGAYRGCSIVAEIGLLISQYDSRLGLYVQSAQIKKYKKYIFDYFFYIMKEVINRRIEGRPHFARFMFESMLSPNLEF